MKTKSTGVRAERKMNESGNCAFVEENSGFASDSAPCLEAGNSMAEGAAEPAPAAWMTPGLIERTHALWSKRYGRSLERCEVLEILRNVRWFGEILRRWMEGRVTT